MNARSTTESEVKLLTDRIRALTPSGHDPREYITDLLDQELEKGSSDRTAMGPVANPPRSAEQTLASARRTAEDLENPANVGARPEGIYDLGVIEWLLRPSLLLRDGLFVPPTSGLWSGLDTSIARSVAQSVCRLDVVQEWGKGIQIGTGFVVGTDEVGRKVLITNAHVVEQSRLWTGWPDVRGMELACSFTREVDQIEAASLILAREVRVHPRYDLALLFIPDQPGRCLPAALSMSWEAPELTTWPTVGVVGHPSFNSSQDAFPKWYGFGDLFGVKRFSPGYLRGAEERVWRGQAVNVALHDATTLSGSSGSCVVDLQSRRILGLHVGGWPLPQKHVTTSNKDMVATLFESNGAVPLWSVKNDIIFGGIHLPIE